MSPRIWSRLSGMALLIGGLLTLVFATILGMLKNANYPHMYTHLQSPSLQSPWWLLLNLMGILGSVLILIGLPAVYASQSKRMGWLGLVGLVLTFCAVLLTGVFGVALNQFGIRFLDEGASSLVQGQGTEALDWLFIVDSVIFIVGSILEVPLPIGPAFILAGLLSVVHLVPAAGFFWALDGLGSLVAAAAFSLGLAACGLVLLNRQGTRMVQPVPTAEPHSADIRS